MVPMQSQYITIIKSKYYKSKAKIYEKTYRKKQSYHCIDAKILILQSISIYFNKSFHFQLIYVFHGNQKENPIEFWA